MEELIRLGAYRPGASTEVDEAIKLHRPLEGFLGQSKEESTTIAEGYRLLEQIMEKQTRSETEN
jgi:flagellum-specific ATP synthase